MCSPNSLIHTPKEVRWQVRLVQAGSLHKVAVPPAQISETLS